MAGILLALNTSAQAPRSHPWASSSAGGSVPVNVRVRPQRARSVEIIANAQRRDSGASPNEATTPFRPPASKIRRSPRDTRSPASVPVVARRITPSRSGLSPNQLPGHVHWPAVWGRSERSIRPPKARPGAGPPPRRPGGAIPPRRRPHRLSVAGAAPPARPDRARRSARPVWSAGLFPLAATSRPVRLTAPRFACPCGSASARDGR